MSRWNLFEFCLTHLFDSSFCYSSSLVMGVQILPALGHVKSYLRRCLATVLVAVIRAVQGHMLHALQPTSHTLVPYNVL